MLMEPPSLPAMIITYSLSSDLSCVACKDGRREKKLEVEEGKEVSCRTVFLAFRLVCTCHQNKVSPRKIDQDHLTSSVINSSLIETT